MIYPLVHELAATDAPVRVPVALTCRILGIARQPFYRWLTNPITDVEWGEGADRQRRVRRPLVTMNRRTTPDQPTDTNLTAEYT